MNMDLSGKVAIITGGGSGIGRGIATMFAQLGAAVAVADVDLPNAETVAGELRAAGQQAMAVEVDVQVADAVESMLAQTLERFGGVDILVNSAGVGSESAIVDMLEEEWDWVLGVNLKGTFLSAVSARPGGVGYMLGYLGCVSALNHLPNRGQTAGE